MFSKINKAILTQCAASVMLIAGWAVQPASLVTWYQPEVPKMLRK